VISIVKNWLDVISRLNKTAGVDVLFGWTAAFLTRVAKA
jgi:hypothetical protein